jgi:Ca-activated chloride channel family protein
MKAIISVIFIFLFAFSVFAQTQAEVIVPTTFLRKSPNSTAEKVQEVKQGEKITFEKSESTNGWYYVSIGNGGIKGWINGNTINSSPPPATSRTEAKPNPTPESTVSKTPAPSRRNAAASQTPNRAVSPKPLPTPGPAPIQQTAPRTSSSANNLPTASPTPTPSSSPQENADSQEDNEVLRIDTEEVNLNVRVVDSNNRPVNNLNQADFRVYENDEPQAITSFSTAEVPTNYALVIDNSRSLRTQLEKVAEAGKIIVSMNRPTDETSIVRFVSADKIQVVQDFTTNRNVLRDSLNNLFVEGGQTAIIDAVYQTAKRVDQHEKSRSKDDFKRRALIVVSDGEDRASTRKEQELFDLLRSSEVQIYAIGFVNNLSNQPAFGEEQSRQEKARGFLTRLAQETGGKVYFPNSIDELPQIANDISGELRTQYLLTYAPSGEGNTSQGGFRNIKVVVSDGANNVKRNAITRTGRTAPPVENKPQQTVRQNQRTRKQ